MKRIRPDELPYLSWCIIARGKTDHDVDLLRRCLISLRERTPDAEIVIVDTMSPLASYVEVEKEYADTWIQWAGPRGDWTTDMYAFDDAAAARNHAFEAARGVWRGWIDTDDVLPGPAEVERLLRLNNRWRPPAVAADAVEVLDGGKTPTLEDILRHVEQHTPAQFISAPYLYDGDDQGLARTWQNRERVVLWYPRGESSGTPQFIWREPAHEVLVPRDPANGQWAPLHLPQLLYVHQKKQTVEEMMYSARRHYKILRAEYEAGKRTTRCLLYLGNLCKPIEPEREEQYLREAHQHAVTDTDRMRALIALGNLSAERGLRGDALEAYGAAVQFRPDLPDAWLAGANAAAESLDHARAARWYEEAAARHPSSDSQVSPRALALEIPTRQALSLLRVAEQEVMAGWHDQALRTLIRAEQLARSVMEHGAVAMDYDEARSFWKDVDNRRNSQQMTMNLAAAAQHLIQNDETIKAMEVIKLFPHTAEDHPLRVALEEWAKPLRLHTSSHSAYTAFYAGLTETACVDLGAASHTVEAALPRVKMLIEWLKEHPSASVLEVGCYDGNVGVPALMACPNISYTAVDASALALQRFARFADELVPDKQQRLTLINTSFDPSTRLPVEDGAYDAVVLFEVIEHVADPVNVIHSLLRYLKPGGRLFLSTPCGAYDRGHPEPHPAGRDPRGHVRAMTPRDMANAVYAADGTIDTLVNAHGTWRLGDTMQCIVRPLRRSAPEVSIAVPSALWDWNGSHVEATGIGASEETIVYLSQALAAEGRSVDVYGPVPEAEVHRGVGYWPREQIRHTEGPVIVSRAPSYIRHVDQVRGDTTAPAWLWLQDAYYPDLNAEIAERYKKIIVLTDWHKQAMHERCGVPLSKMTVIPNFVVPDHFMLTQPVARMSHRFVYSSSPDRGLIPLLRLWPHVLGLWPDAELHIFYGWEGCKRLTSNPGWTERYTAIRAAYDKLRWQKGVIDHGRVNHWQIALAMRSSGLWAYPTAFEETFCSNAVKARVAGCIPVAPPVAALAQTAASRLTEWIRPWYEGAEQSSAYVADFLNAIQTAAKHGKVARAEMREAALEQYDVTRVAAQWKDVLDS